MFRPLRLSRGVLLSLASGLIVSFVWLLGLQAQEPGQRSVREKQSPEPGDVNTDASRVYVFVGKMGLGHEHAVVGPIKSGHLHLGSSTEAGQLEFDMTCFTADTEEARRYLGLKGATARATQADVTRNMLGSDVLDVRRFPAATFKIESAQRLKPQPGQPSQYELSGKFTLHGVTRNLRFAVAAERKDGKLHVWGRFAIRQTEFGITPFSKGFGAVGVADSLTIHGEIWIADDME